MLDVADYETRDAMALAELVTSGEVTPKELLEVAISLIEERNPALNAVVNTLFDRAAAKVEALPQDGPLRGVPFLLKDLKLQLEGTITTDSTRLYRDRVATRSSVLAERYEAAGLQILGKTNTPEMGIMGTTESALRGPARNPWALDRTPGGSSGGSSAAVAARMVPVAHGGDGGGSIRIPASCCGLFGIKPTRGRVSMAPFYGEGWCGFVQENVMSRSVRDSALLLDIACETTLGEPYAAPYQPRSFLEELDEPQRPLRIAFTEDTLFAGETHPDCQAAVRDAVTLLEELGHEVVEAKPEFSREELVRAYFLVVGAGTSRFVETAAAYAGGKPRAADFEAATWILAQIGWANSASELMWARDVMQRAGRDVAGFFEGYDAFLTSTMARPPAHIGELLPTAGERFQLSLVRHLGTKRVLNKVLDELGAGKLAYTPNTQLFNQTGQPAMSVPLYWNDDGLPIGVQFAGRFGDEATLFRLAKQLEGARPWSDRRPPVR